MPRPRRAVIIVVVLGLLAAAGVGVYLLNRPAPSPHLQAAQEAIDRRDFAAASTHLDKHLAEHPEDVEARLLAARTARRAGDTSAFLKHLELHKQNHGPPAARAFEYQLLQAQQGDLSEAAELLDTHTKGFEATLAQEAVIIGSVTALRNRDGCSGSLPAGPNHTAVLLGRRAAEAWLAAEPAKPDLVRGLVWRGRLRVAGGEYAGGVADFRKALEHDPGFLDASLQLGISVLTDDPAEAATQLELVRQFRAEDRNVLTPLAVAYRSLGRHDDARKLLESMIARNANDVRSLLELGLLELDAGRPEEAEKHLRNALGLVPTDPPILHAMSRCMTLAGKPTEAKFFQERFDEAQRRSKQQ